MSEPRFARLEGYPQIAPEECISRAGAFAAQMAMRRTVRDFSAKPVPREVVELAIKAAATAPSGANKQPWHFALIESADMKRRIREAAEEEERAFYGGRAGEAWLEDLAPFGTDWRKPFLETAPYLIVVFQQNYGQAADGSRTKNYYIQESVGIASGLLLAALHTAGLATLTHTPSPMGFLREICRRPANERAVMIVVVGRPAENAPGAHHHQKTVRGDLYGPLEHSVSL